MASDPQQNINDVMAIISLAIKAERVGSGVYVTSFDSSGHSDPRRSSPYRTASLLAGDAYRKDGTYVRGQPSRQ